MKVLIVRNSFTYDFGGAERLAVLLGKQLKLNNVDVAVITHHKMVLSFAASQGIATTKGPWWSLQNWSGKNLLLFPLFILWQIVLIVWYLGATLRHRADALHLMSRDDFIAGTLAGKLLRKRIIWTDTADLKFVYANNHIWYKNPVGKIVLLVSRLAHVVTMVSKSEQVLIEESLRHPVPKNYRVIYMVGSDEKVTPVKRPAGELVIFCATSRLVIAKGIGELIKAFALITEKNPSYRLWIVGDGPDAAQFKDKAKDIETVTFFGHKDKPLEYLAAADIYVHPTYHEGFSLGLAEAAMLAKPIVATNVGGNPELVGDNNGILVPTQDAASLAVAMHQLANDPATRTAMGKHARYDFVEKFDLAKVTKRDIIPLYEKSTH